MDKFRDKMKYFGKNTDHMLVGTQLGSGRSTDAHSLKKNKLKLKANTLTCAFSPKSGLSGCVGSRDLRPTCGSITGFIFLSLCSSSELH